MKNNFQSGIIPILLTIIFSSCEKSLSEIMKDREQDGYDIVFYNEDCFVYSNSKTIGYYDHNEKIDSIIYKDGETEICLYEPQLKISDSGDITIVKDYSKNAYNGYLDYFDKQLMTEEVRKALTKGLKFIDSENKPIFFDKDRFVVSYDSRKFLICYHQYQSIEAVLVDDEAGYEISNPDYDAHKFNFNLNFTFADLPINLQPRFQSSILNAALYNPTIEGEDNPLRWFSVPFEIESNGVINEEEYINYNNEGFTIQQSSFKDKKTLRNAIEKNKDIISDKYYDLIYHIAVDHAQPLEYYYEVFCNKNELQRLFGKTCYINGTIERISGKDDDGEYYLSFDYSTFDNIFFFINGYTRDQQIANLHLPAHVLIKGVLGEPNGFSTNHMTFRDIELRGIVKD